jgi:hypothetical protein
MELPFPFMVSLSNHRLTNVACRDYGPSFDRLRMSEIGQLHLDLALTPLHMVEKGRG